MRPQRGMLFQPTFAFPMVSVCVLAGAFLVYYFPVTAQQEAALNRRAFRSLAAVADSVTNRVANYAEVLEQRTKRRQPSGDSPVTDFVVEGQGGECRRPEVTAGSKAAEGAHELVLRCHEWTGTVRVDRFLTPYLRDPQQLFDDVLLTDAAGVVLFSTLRTGSRLNSVHTARLRAPGNDGGTAAGADETKAPAVSFASAAESSTLVLASIAGEEYRLYLVPVTLNLRSASADTARFVLVGMLSAARFRRDSMAVPGAALVSAILLVLIVIAAAWPLLKFATMGASERIPARSAAYLFLSTLATIVLVCILAIHLRYTVDLGAVDDDLGRLAARIESNLERELRLALRVLDSAQRSEPFAQSLRLPAADCESFLSTADTVPRRVPELLTRTGVRLSDYPYFDRLFWSDTRGHQHVKWEAGPRTPATVVRDRAYFVETSANRLWQFAGDPQSPLFRVDSVLSRNTGEYRAIVSQAAPPATLCPGVRLSVASMVTPLLSLIDPVMPPDYGFAVVDGEGAVQFHSTSAKNGAERLLDEVGHRDDVQAALLGRQATLLTTPYLGTSHRLLVTPLATLEHSPWSLIVFHDLSAGTAQHLGRIVLFAVLAVSYFLAVLLLTLAMPASRRPRPWMWPRAENRGAYLHLTLTTVVLAVLFYGLIFTLSRPAAVLLVAASVPILIGAMGLLALKPVGPVLPRIALAALAILGAAAVWFEPESKRQVLALTGGILLATASLGSVGVGAWLARFRRPSLTSSYAALWASFLVVIALLPCVACFRVAYDYHGNVSTRRQQLRTLAALQEREGRVKSTYADRALTTNPGTADAARWLFVRRRLEESLDRYDLVLRSTGSGQLFSATSSGSSCDGGLPRYLRALASLDPYADGTPTLATDDRTPRSMWTWCREGANRLRLGNASTDSRDSAALSLPPTRALFQFVRRDPVFLNPELVSELPSLQAWALPVPLLAFAATALITFLWVRPTIRQMFLLDIAPAAVLPEVVLDERAPITGNQILLTLDRQQTSDVFRRRQDTFIIDCAEATGAADVDVTAITQPVVALDHFDYCHDDAAANASRLRLLERLGRLQPPKRIVIISTMDPVFLFAPPPGAHRHPPVAQGSGHDTDRWATVLARFSRSRVAHSAPSSGQARGRAVWAASTAAERSVIYQLAHDGWVNPRNDAALEELEARGVLTGRPCRFTDPAVQMFVEDRISPHDRRAWAPPDASTKWDGIRLMFVVVILAVVAAALFFSQQSVLGLVATGLGVLTPLTKLLSEAHSFRSLLGFGKASS